MRVNSLKNQFILLIKIEKDICRKLFINIKQEIYT
mgnify:CR=1 FL=1